jgi:hypothetical protein
LSIPTVAHATEGPWCDEDHHVSNTVNVMVKPHDRLVPVS